MKTPIVIMLKHRDSGMSHAAGSRQTGEAVVSAGDVQHMVDAFYLLSGELNEQVELICRRGFEDIKSEGVRHHMYGEAGNYENVARHKARTLASAAVDLKTMGISVKLTGEDTLQLRKLAIPPSATGDASLWQDYADNVTNLKLLGVITNMPGLNTNQKRRYGQHQPAERELRTYLWSALQEMGKEIGYEHRGPTRYTLLSVSRFSGMLADTGIKPELSDDVMKLLVQGLDSMRHDNEWINFINHAANLKKIGLLRMERPPDSATLPQTR